MSVSSRERVNERRGERGSLRRGLMLQIWASDGVARVGVTRGSKLSHFHTSTIHAHTEKVTICWGQRGEKGGPALRAKTGAAPPPPPPPPPQLHSNIPRYAPTHPIPPIPFPTVLPLFSNRSPPLFRQHHRRSPTTVASKVRPRRSYIPERQHTKLTATRSSRCTPHCSKYPCPRARLFHGLVACVCLCVPVCGWASEFSAKVERSQRHAS